MATEYTRRTSDAAEQHNIDMLIADENDPKIRLQLMVMNRINLSLIANTETVTSLKDKLDTHLNEYEKHIEYNNKLLNQGKGAWKIIMWVLGIVQVLTIAAWADYRSDIKSISAQLATDNSRHSVIDTRLNALERK